jgi:hypothetical protein
MSAAWAERSASRNAAIAVAVESALDDSRPDQ